MTQAQAQAQVVGSTVDGQAQGRVAGAARRLGSEIAKFGTVGAIAFVIDVSLFNILRAGVLSDSPLTAKTISVIVATAFAYVANRNWTYRDRARTGYGRETALFFATNAAALLISWACLAFTHYLLGLDSQLADNISGNVIAVGLGTLFRFWVYRTWVFPTEDPVVRPGSGPLAEPLIPTGRTLAAAARRLSRPPAPSTSARRRSETEVARTRPNPRSGRGARCRRT